jgi:hypothetical protein
MMKNAIAILLLAGLGSCSFFGEKNKVGDYIEKPDYSLKSVEYVPVLPYFAEGLKPVSLYSGYDELLYVVDSAKAIYSYDAAGRQLGRFELPNVYFVIQNRSLDLYALARVDTTINGLLYNLPAIFKISQKEFADGNTTLLNLSQAEVTKRMVYPYCINEANKLTDKTAIELTKLNAIGFLDDNSYYVTSSGPQENNTQYITRKNSILSFTNKDVFVGGFSESGSIEPLGITTLVQPPQRARMEARKDFLYTSITDGLAISTRFMQITVDAEGTPTTSFKPLALPSNTESSGYLYQTFRFKKPTAVLYGGTSQKYVFLIDEATDSIHVFQENGYEGTTPPPQYSNRKLIKVGFGGHGSGPAQFGRPAALAYFNRMLYVADAQQKRVARFKLSSDYE